MSTAVLRRDRGLLFCHCGHRPRGEQSYISAMGTSCTASDQRAADVAPTDAGMEPLEDAAVSLGMVESVADAILGCRSFAVALAYVLSLLVHKYGVADRLESPLDWDRKAWSHLHTPTELDVPLDPPSSAAAGHETLPQDP